jgi:hypothetical protein
MKLSPWRSHIRGYAVGLLAVSIVNMGMMSAASAAIVDTSALVSTDREADLGAIRSQLTRADVRAQMEQMGVDAATVDKRVSRLNAKELHQLAADMRSAPAGGDVLALIGAVFVVLLVLEVTGVIDIFKKR